MVTENKLSDIDFPVLGDPVDEGALQQIIVSRRFCDRVALMADHHKGYGVPIGGVMASREFVSPTAVGYDIACGNKAARIDLPAEELRTNIERIMDDLVATISFGVGRTSSWDVSDHELFTDPEWTNFPDLFGTPNAKGRTLFDTAVVQLGTVGSGNHYVDLFVDEQERVWIGVHFGSRGVGHKIATHFLEAANAAHGMDAEPAVLHQDSDLGEQYIRLKKLAGKYAYAGRDLVVSKVAEMLGAEIHQEVHNHHNFAWRETHEGEDYWVMRKGATPAFPGQLGFVGGSMGDESVILEGVESEIGPSLLYSTVHGAGRVMSRTAATGRDRKGRQIREGRVSREEMRNWIGEKGVTLRGADTDEAPQAYKRLPEVLAHHAGTVKVLHVLQPVGVAMAGSDVFDPYKD